MTPSEIIELAKKLAEFVRSLPDFKFYDSIDGNYNHMGATVADAILSPRNNYEIKVRPRVNRIRELYRDARTTSQVRRLLKENISASDFLNWNEKNNSERFSRVKRFCRVLELFASEGIEVQEDLRKWLSQESSFGKLRSIKGIGPTTIDYFKLLVFMPGSAMTMPLQEFPKLAGLPPCIDLDAQAIIDKAADFLNVNRANFDHSIWWYMIKRRQNESGE